MNPAVSVAGCDNQSGESISELLGYPYKCPVESNAAYDFSVAECRSQFEGCGQNHLVCPENVSSNSAEAYCDNFSDVGDSSFADSESDLNGLSDNVNADMPQIRVQLAEWAISNNVSHSTLGSLLRILKPYHDTLPIDPRTLLKTPQIYDVKTIQGPGGQVGQYCHFGIASGISKKLLTSGVPSVHSLLSLQFNFDGLPLFKSSGLEFWPILCLMRQYDMRPCVVGLYCGCKKPGNISEYMHDFISELGQLLQVGLNVDSIHLSVKIANFVCDAPARSFVKNIKSHNGYRGCEKCTHEGVHQ